MHLDPPKHIGETVGHVAWSNENQTTNRVFEQTRSGTQFIF